MKARQAPKMMKVGETMFIMKLPTPRPIWRSPLWEYNYWQGDDGKERGTGLGPVPSTYDPFASGEEARWTR